MQNEQIIYGSRVLQNSAPKAGKPFLRFPGKTLDGGREFAVDRDVFARHLLLLGGSGCGKTNTFLFILEQLEAAMRPQDVAIIFDTKGEFYEKFGRPGDIVIGNSRAFRQKSYSWNLFQELLADGWDEEAVKLNAREIAAALFHDRGSSTQPFFCNAARDLFAGILLHFVRQAQRHPEQWMARLNNACLTEALQAYGPKSYERIFSNYPDTKSLLSYIGDGSSNQALGVFGELNSMISEYFIGVFASSRPGREVSMRRAVRGKGARKIFVEYDLSVGETLTPIYRLLVDQALKEALGRGPEDRDCLVYLVADEFKLLPKLQHIDDALNFGRGQGVRVVAGIQSIDQLYDIYGREKGAVIASGFGSLFAFHTNDSSSREYIERRFGKNLQAYVYSSRYLNEPLHRERDGNTVEEWDQMNLGLGQAVIGLGEEKPFLFQFDHYEKVGKYRG